MDLHDLGEAVLLLLKARWMLLLLPAWLGNDRICRVLVDHRPLPRARPPGGRLKDGCQSRRCYVRCLLAME